MSETKEIRFEVSREDAATLDAYCQATGKNATQLMRELLVKWSRAKRHEAMMICRMLTINPMAPDQDGK